MNVTFINYLEMQEFYTIREACQLFLCEKAELKQACEKYKVSPCQNEMGEYGFPRYDVCKLHNALYYANKDRQSKNDPWA